MISELYGPIEIRTSKHTIEILAERLPNPIIILGGWAVYLTVNDSFKEEFGSTYLGSRDVDIGFHVDPCWESDELNECDLSKALHILEEIGYQPFGTSRFYKIIHRESGETLTEDVAKDYPAYELFYLFIDPIVDEIHPKSHKSFKIKLIDEPLLGKACKENLFVKVDDHKCEIIMPIPEILLAAKLNSFPNRTKDDKKVKDACDIYALLWHSPIKYKELIHNMKEQFPELCNNVTLVLENSISTKASDHLGIEKEVYIRVINGLLI